ncbi:MAG: ATP-binding protein [Anaerolineaceae bacterium]|jgi:predicted AAA+ superfamily ATPase|nr:ATP-binding protein [Anaerolineaceae bacterium]
MISRKEYIEKVKPFIGKDLVKVFTGIRRSGKSSLLELLKDTLIAEGSDASLFYSLNLEELRYQAMPALDIHDEIKAFCDKNSEKSYIFLDEVQEINNWERLVNSLRAMTNADIYITGSNSNLLSGELATHLAGRYIEIPVFPLSFKEIYDWNIKNNSSVVDGDKLFQQYLRVGGFPFIHASFLEEQAALSYLRDIYQSIMLKDVVARHQVRDVELLNRIFLYLLSNTGQTFSGKSLSDYLKSERRQLSLETLYNYIAYAEEAFLVYLSSRYDIRGKRILSYQEKIFLADIGIREAVYGNNERDISQILENIVYLELIRRGYKVKIGRFDAQEIDFVADRRGEKIYFQVAYILADENTIDREFSVLEKINDNFPKYVLSLDKFDRSRNGILHKNIIDFLLEYVSA